MENCARPGGGDYCLKSSRLFLLHFSWCSVPGAPLVLMRHAALLYSTLTYGYPKTNLYAYISDLQPFCLTILIRLVFPDFSIGLRVHHSLEPQVRFLGILFDTIAVLVHPQKRNLGSDMPPISGL